MYSTYNLYVQAIMLSIWTNQLHYPNLCIYSTQYENPQIKNTRNWNQQNPSEEFQVTTK